MYECDNRYMFKLILTPVFIENQLISVFGRLKSVIAKFIPLAVRIL